MGSPNLPLGLQPSPLVIGPYAEGFSGEILPIDGIILTEASAPLMTEANTVLLTE